LLTHLQPVGQCAAAQHLADRIVADNARRAPKETFLVLLGDLIDRGPQSKDVVELVRTGALVPFATLSLSGNHEEALVSGLRGRPDLVVATPGRMLDHLRNTPGVHGEDVDVLVLDEADRLLEMGFEAEVSEVVRLCPIGRQTMLFSATMTS
jgi:hypothetical protein